MIYQQWCRLDCVDVRCCQVRDQGASGFLDFGASLQQLWNLRHWSPQQKTLTSPSGRWVSRCQHLVSSQLWRSTTVASTSVPGLTSITNKCITWPSEWYLMCSQAVRKTLFEYIYMFIFVGLQLFNTIICFLLFLFSFFLFCCIVKTGKPLILSPQGNSVINVDLGKFCVIT